MKSGKSPTGQQSGREEVLGAQGVPEQEKTQLRYGPTGKPQRVKSRGYHWCEETEDEFFDILAASCNVTLACESVGFSTPTVYRFRNERPEFDARWQAALALGYDRLELELLRAAHDSLADVKPFDADRPIPKMTVEQAMNVLRAHRNEVNGIERRGPGKRARRKSFAEVRDAVIKKIEAIERARGERP